jgi:hypothetical protein
MGIPTIRDVTTTVTLSETRRCVPPPPILTFLSSQNEENSASGGCEYINFEIESFDGLQQTDGQTDRLPECLGARHPDHTPLVFF